VISVGRRNCGRRLRARSTGPATSCGKKLTKSAKLRKSRSVVSFPRYRSIV